MSRRSPRSTAFAARPFGGGMARISRAALAASVSLTSLVAFGAPATAQDAGTLPGAQVLQGGRWTGARMPTVAQGNEGLVMTIKQEQERALLDWARFNIAKGEEVRFEQDGVDWIALNRIFDSRPSEIAGKITAKGQVWLQNTNGIIFKNGAQVNAHTIIATALPITERQLNEGLLSGNGVIRGTMQHPFYYDFSGWNLPMVPKPTPGLDPNVLLNITPVAVGGQNPTLIDLMARAAIRQAVLRDRDYEGASNVYEQGYGFELLTYRDPVTGRTSYMVDPAFSNAGLVQIMEAIVAEIDVSELGDFDYQNFTYPYDFFTNPAKSAAIPQALRDAVAAKIKSRFIDNYEANYATAQANYQNYIANSRVTVEQGATLTSVTSDSSSPGKIMLFGPNVTNGGKLVANDGQVLLAAGEHVKLSAQQGLTNSIRGGLAVNVMGVAITDTAGSVPGVPCCSGTQELWLESMLPRAADVGMTATNTGEIVADRGSVSMTGRNVDQLGSILVTNGVRQRNGAIVLQASHGFNMSEYSNGGNYFGGTLTLGENSVTSITPDLSSLTGLAADTFAKGRVLLAGTDIVLEENAKVVSRSGEVIIHANPYGSGARGGSSPAANEGTPGENRGDAGSFTMRTGALIDVSGLRNVERGVADNIFSVEVRSNEVSGSPKQRDGILIGETVYVDRREGASIVDWTGALSGEQRTAAQMSTEGGTVQIRASKSAVVDDGAVIDVSGGSTSYLGGEVKTTRLKDSQGRFHDISDADPNRTYVGLYEATRTEAGYVEGADAGSVELLSGSAKLFGKLKGDVVVGERQELASIGRITAPRVPVGAVGASLVTSPSMPEMGSATLHRGGPDYAPWTSTFAFITADEKAFTGTLWRETENNSDIWEAEELLLDASLIGQDWSEYEGAQPEYVSFIEDDFFSGMGSVSLGYGSSHQTQTLNPGVSINMAPGGSFVIGAESGIQTVGDGVSIITPSGEIGFGSGNGVTMGSNVLLSVAAPWVNDADAPEGAAVGHVDGGTISLLGVKLTGPITVDARGGGWYRRLSPPTRTSPGEFELIEGRGGNISLGQNGMALSEIVSQIDFNLGGLGGDGTLGLYASGDLVIGPRGGGSNGGAEYVTDAFLNGIGAGNLLLGAGSISVIDGAHLLQQRRSLSFGGSPIDVATGTDLRDATELTLLPAHLRPGGNLSLTAGSLSIERGAIVEVDPTGVLTVQGNVMQIDGTLCARGGSIAVGGLDGGDISIGSTAVLDAAGIAQTVRTPGGIDGRTFWYDGRILDGGSIAIEGANLIVDSGAMIDVSGASGPLAVLRPGRYAAVKVNDIIGSDAGAIDITAAGGYVLGTFKGDAGSASNYAGTLNISGGASGNLLAPGYGGNGQPGVQQFLDNLQYAFFPEPTPEAPVSLRQFFADNYSWMEGSLGFGPADIEDIQITSIAEFVEFMSSALAPLVAQSPEDTQGALQLDPTLNVLPDLPPPASGGIFGVPPGYTPGDIDAFDRAMTFLFQGPLSGPNASQLGRGTTLHVGASPLANMPRFDTVSIGGNIKSSHDVTVASGRVLNVGGLVTGTGNMRFTGRNIYLAGLLPDGHALDPARSGMLTISGETVEFASKFNVGGFEKVVIEASGDMRGGYSAQPLTVDSEFTPGLYATGDILLRAAQIYPTTDGTLAFGSPRSIRIESNGDSLAPLSAGGLLAFTAPLIEQAGTLRAPFGEIRLTATRTAVLDENGDPVLGEDGQALFNPGEVRLLPGSVTSTSADGRTILYGSTFDGQSWFAPLRNELDGELTTPPEKRVSLTGDVINVRQGAVIDVSGSGDVLGLEFVAGPLGQANVLDGPGVYAIVPAYGSSVIAPIDPLYNPRGNPSDPGMTDLGIGDAVWLAAFDGNAAGWYTLLPAEYALTPGGYRITLAANGIPAIPEAKQTGDDSFAVLGYRGVLGTSIADQVQSAYRVERGTDVRKRSEFFETYGNSFFSSERFLEGLQRSGNPFNADPRLPIDGGFLTLAANTSLTLDGTILAAGASGVSGSRGGVVDIASDNIVIAAAGTDTGDLAGYLVLDPNKLSNIAESLLIGGIRRQGATGLEIVTGQLTRDSVDEVRSPEKSVGAENVVIRTDAANPLTGTELLFAANESVRVETGSVVRAVGNGTDSADLAIAPSMPAYIHPWDPGQSAPAYDSGGAFMRVSNLGEIQVSRTNVISTGGDMIVEAGATVEATDAVLLDSTRDTLVGNGATIKAGAITAAAGLVSFGDAPSGTTGLVVSGGTLEGLGQATRLTLKSYSTFDFYGDVDLNFTGAAVFDGAALVDRGATAGSVSIAAGTLELRNSDAVARDETGSGGSLALAGGNVIFGEGDIDIAYGATSIDADQRLIFDGLGENSFDGSLSVRAVEITGSSGAGHQIAAAGALELLAGTPGGALSAFPTAGALLDFTGTSVDIGTTIRAGSGTVRATATEGDVRLASGALIDVSGADVSFFEVQGFLPGGGVQLTSVAGDVFVEDGSTVNIAGGRAGGDAGALVLSAGRGIAVLDGALEAAVASGYRGGSFGLTTSTLADFGGLNALLNASGFSRSRDFAILDGDVTLNGVTRVDALRIVTGTGDITVAADARIGSGSDKGGSILLASGGDLVIADGAAFDVSAKGENARGGSVDLQVAEGGTIDAGAVAINVAGGGTGEGGQVRLRAAQTGNDVGVARWSAQVAGGDIQLEAFRAYDLADADGDASNGHLAEIDTALQQQVIGDASTFMTANADAIRARLGQSGNSSFAVVPGIELRSEGDLDLVHHWNLAAARFDGRAGVLTLRAGGDLLINANLSDGFVSAVHTPDGVKPPNGWGQGSSPLAPPPLDFTNDQSWSYNLIGGADFAQTNVLSTLAGSDGDVMVGGLVRTGTGDIRIAASGNLDYEDPSFVEYRFGTSATGGVRAGTKITIPVGTVIPDGTVMKATTYSVPTTVPNPANPGGPRIPFTATITVYPRLPAGTVLRKGTKVPAGTVMPGGSTLGADTVLTADVTLMAETVFPGELTIAGKTRTGSAMTWEVLRVATPSMPGVVTNMPVDPVTGRQLPIPGTGDNLQRVTFSIAGLGDVQVSNNVNGYNTRSLIMADGRRYEDESQFNLEPDFRRVEQLYGAIYTVGMEAAPIANFDPAELVGYANNNNNGMLINPAYLEKGGDIAINVAGSILGAGTVIENMRWLTASGGTPTSSLYNNFGGKDPNAPFNAGQTSMTILADNFRQGVGALGGGDINITAGGDVDNLTVALPTSLRVSGGIGAGAAKQVHYTGGGDLVMDVGRNLMGGLIQVSQGTGTIDVAGSVIATQQTTGITMNPQNPANLTLVLDDANVSLQAGGDVELRGITSTLGVAGRPLWLGYTQNTSVAVTSLGGDISLYDTTNEMDFLPSKTAFVATAGSISFGRADQQMGQWMVDMWPDTRVDILAQQNVHFWGAGGNYMGADFTIGWSDPDWIARATNPGGYLIPMFGSLPGQNPLTGQYEFNQAGPGYGIDGPNVHSGSASYSRIYAAQGDLVGHGVQFSGAAPGAPHGGAFTFGHETRLKAGNNIRMGVMNFLTHDGSDISTIEAGGAIYLPDAVLYGPGRLWVQAGDEIYMGRTEGAGIRAREAVSKIPTSTLINGGSISVLAGIDQEPEYEAFFDYYLDPENVAEAPSWLREYFVEGDRGLSVSTDVVLKDGSTRTTIYAIELVNYMRRLNGEAPIPTEAFDEISGSRPITPGALAAQIDPAEYAAALEAFEALDPVLKRPLAVRILNAELKTAGREAVGRSPETDGRYVRNGDPTRGYDAVGRLFPGAQRRPGEALAEGEHSWTGDINMMVSQIRGESGGSVDLLAPGGSIQLASLSVANTSPGAAGIVTQRGGGINAVTYGDYIVNQSRTMTADDGDILIWSSYGNIDAGRGRKTSLSVPPVAFQVDAFGQTRIKLSGLPNGAGIATLDQVDGKQGGDVDLYAFNGIVNAGDAGIRASRDLFVGAIEIRGLDNITVGGETNVDLTSDEGSIGPLNLENFAQSAEDDALDNAFNMAAEVEKLRTVRQTILTGSVVSFGTEGCVPSEGSPCPAN